ncbi:MAG: hydrogenase expression/formation protein HypE [Bryobacterales bacterium]|nr:hydrogenase expression/formation protein HypE [Bryobacterales bacterium]
MADSPDFDSLTCPAAPRDYPNIVIAHGGGGRLSAELVEQLFLPAFRNEALEDLGDSAVLHPPPGRVAFSTDSFVVRPLFFPGGCIGDLAVNGTINDIAMSGAMPLYLSAGFILEEGFPMASLVGIAERMAKAAREAGVQIVAGDTKVVERGHGDGCYINTSGFGVLPEGLRIGPAMAQPGDAVLISGTAGDHGMAIMSVREGLEFGSLIESDCAALHTMARRILDATPHVHVLRDPTRGGVASALNEIAAKSNAGIVIDERNLPVQPAVQAACELLGLDPVYVANEGKLLAIVAPEAADAALAAMKAHPLGGNAAILGEVTSRHPGMVLARTAIGGTRVIPMQIGEQLPRIC